MADNQAEVDKRAADAAKAAQDADKKRQEEVRKKITEERSAREKAAKEGSSYSAANVKPTPTQEECDLAASGVHLPEHEADGSDEQQPTGTPQNKEAKPGTTKAGYATRQTETKS